MITPRYAIVINVSDYLIKDKCVFLCRIITHEHTFMSWLSMQGNGLIKDENITKPS